MINMGYVHLCILGKLVSVYGFAGACLLLQLLAEEAESRKVALRMAIEGLLASAKLAHQNMSAVSA